MSLPVVVAELHTVGPVRTGLWASCCQLPSLVEQDFVLADRVSLRIGGRGTFRVCADCGARP